MKSEYEITITGKQFNDAIRNKDGAIATCRLMQAPLENDDEWREYATLSDGRKVAFFWIFPESEKELEADMLDFSFDNLDRVELVRD